MDRRGCETCVLQAPEAAAEALDVLCEKLGGCEGCEVRERSPEIRLLVGRLLDAARSLRRAEQRARRWEARYEEIASEQRRHEERIEILEAMQQAGLAETDAELQAKVALVDQQRRAILALSVPIIQVGERVLALPLIGGLDEERAALLTSRLLEEIVARRARSAIVDLTGIEAIDEAIAARLLRLAQAVRLLGAEVILTGVRGEAARALVGIGAALSALRIRRNVKDALRTCRGAEREIGL
jgi:anti-anti-sigma regulatory factor